MEEVICFGRCYSSVDSDSRYGQVIDGQGDLDSAVTKLSSLISSPDAAKIAGLYLEEDVSSNPVFRACAERVLGHYVHEEGKSGFGLIMNALKYGILISPYWDIAY